MTIAFRAAEIPESDLDAGTLGPPAAVPLTGTINTRNKVFYSSDDEQIVSGTWECEPSASRWEFLTRGEFIHVLSGRMIVQEDGQDAIELTKGSTAVFPIGWRGVWTVKETLRKVFVVYQPS